MSLNLNDKLRRGAASAVAVLTSASLVVGGVFHPPADLPQQSDLVPPPIVADDDDLDGDGKNKKPAQPAEPEAETVEAPEAEPALPEEEKKGVRRWWGALSLRYRLLLIPVCALLGWGLFQLAAAFLPGLIGRIVSWLAALAALGCGFVAAEKAVFPDIPVRKLLKTRNFAGLLSGLAVLGAADVALPLLWSGYGKWELLLHALGITAVFVAAGLSFARRAGKETPAPAPEPEPEPGPEELRPLTNEEILALADTVSRPRK